MLRALRSTVVFSTHLVVVPTAKNARAFAHETGDPAHLRQNLPTLARLLEPLEPLERRQTGGESTWAETLAPHLARALTRPVAAGDLFAVLLAALYTDLLAPERSPAKPEKLVQLRAALDDRMERDRLARLGHALLDPTQDCSVLELLQGQQPLPLLFPLIELLSLVLGVFPGGGHLKATRVVRIPLALHAYGADAIRCLIAQRGGARPEGVERHIWGQLTALLGAGEIEQLLAQAGTTAERLFLLDLLGVSGREDLQALLLALLLGDDRLAAARAAEILTRSPPGAIPDRLAEETLRRLSVVSDLPRSTLRSLVDWALLRPELEPLLASLDEAQQRWVVLEAVTARLLETDGGLDADARTRLQPLLLEAATVIPPRALPAAVQALARAGLAPTLRPALQRRVEALLRAPDPATVLAALDLCSTLELRQLRPSIEALAGGAGEVRAAALEVLLRFEAGVAANTLQLAALAVDDDPATRERADAALRAAEMSRVADLARALRGSPIAPAEATALLADIPPDQHRAAGVVLARTLSHSAGAATLNVLVLATQHAEPLHPVVAALLDELDAASETRGATPWLLGLLERDRSLEIQTAVLALVARLRPDLDLSQHHDALRKRCGQAMRDGTLSPELARTIFGGDRGRLLPLSAYKALAQALARAIVERRTRAGALALLPALEEIVFPYVLAGLDLTALGKKARAEVLRGFSVEGVTRALARPGALEDLEALAALYVFVAEKGSPAAALQQRVRELIVAEPHRVLARLAQLRETHKGAASLLHAAIHRVLTEEDIRCVLELLADGPRVEPSLLEALATAPALRLLVGPPQLARLLELYVADGLGDGREWGELWSALGRREDPRRALERMLGGDPCPTVELFGSVGPAVALELALVLLERREGAYQLAMLAALDRLVELGPSAVEQDVPRVLAAVARQARSAQEPVRQRALTLLGRVRQLIPATAAVGGPFRGVGSPVDLQAVDRLLEAAAPPRAELPEDPAAGLRERVAMLDRLGPEDLTLLLENLVEQEAIWALPALADRYRSGVDALESVFERTMEALAELQSREDGLVCLDCLAHFARHDVRTGLLSRVRFLACGHCGRIGHVVVGVERIALVVEDVGVEAPAHRVEGGCLIVRWPPQTDSATYDEVVLRTVAPTVLQDLVAWAARGTRRYPLRAEVPLPADQRKTLAHWFEVEG